MRPSGPAGATASFPRAVLETAHTSSLPAFTCILAALQPSRVAPVELYADRKSHMLPPLLYLSSVVLHGGNNTPSPNKQR